jgi:hypothetical protein
MSNPIKHKYAAGDVVWLKHLKQKATITRFDKKGLLYVNLDQVEIPVFFHDISPYQEPVDYTKNETQQQVVEEPRANYLKYHFDATGLLGSGVLLMFVPEQIADGETIHYDLILINESSEYIQINYKLISTYGIYEQGRIAVKSKAHTGIAHFKTEIINDIRQFDYQIIPQTNDKAAVSGSQKFSAASLVKHEAFFQPMKRTVFQYELLKQFFDKPKEKDLFTETHEPFEVNVEQLKSMMQVSPKQKEFDVIVPEKEVDLHIEKITPDIKGLSKTDILLTQIEHFNKALDRAIRSGQKVFFAIHGNGSGKLKKEIHKILESHSEVVSFDDDYTPQYAFGATRIILR